MANAAPRPCLLTHSQSHTHIHSLSFVLVAVMNSKEFKTKISHAHSLILSITCTCCYDKIKGTQDLKIYSHAASLILSHSILALVGFLRTIGDIWSLFWLQERLVERGEGWVTADTSEECRCSCHGWVLVCCWRRCGRWISTRNYGGHCVPHLILHNLTRVDMQMQ